VGSTYVCNNNRLAISSHWIVNVQILGLRFLHCQRNRPVRVYADRSFKQCKFAGWERGLAPTMMRKTNSG
jgi:hypothetical protein